MRFLRLGWLFLTVLALGALVIVMNRHHSGLAATTKAPESLRPTSPAPTVAINRNAPTPEELTRLAARYPDFKSHPFAVAKETSSFSWTAEDGKDLNVIKELAHNELEFERLVSETSRILRRQLVYHKDTADMQVEQAKLTGAHVQQLMLPGLDGQEVPFQITRSELNPSGQAGTFTGEISGKPGSMVTLAFKGGREAFTILSPADKLYLVGEPREPGELIVKSIDPATYVPGLCGNQ